MTAEDLREAKRRLRTNLIRAIRSLGPAQRVLEEAALGRGFPDLPGLRAARRVLLYVGALPEEIDTSPFIGEVLARRQTLVLPRVDPVERRLVLHRVEDVARDLVPGPFQAIPEPRPTCPIVAAAEVDWVLAPGLAFDRDGHRLGRGAGHYDRLLAEVPRSSPRWAVAYTVQVVERVPVGPHDQPLHGVLTSQGRLGPGADPRGPSQVIAEVVN